MLRTIIKNKHSDFIQGGKDMENENYLIPFNIILHAGNAKSMAMEALYNSREGKLERAEKMIEEANIELIEAHKSQTKMLQEEASGSAREVSVVLCHSMDHIVMATTTVELAEEIIMLRREMKSLKNVKGEAQ